MWWHSPVCCLSLLCSFLFIPLVVYFCHMHLLWWFTFLDDSWMRYFDTWFCIEVVTVHWLLFFFCLSFELELDILSVVVSFWYWYLIWTWYLVIDFGMWFWYWSIDIIWTFIIFSLWVVCGILEVERDFKTPCLGFNFVIWYMYVDHTLWALYNGSESN